MSYEERVVFCRRPTLPAVEASVSEVVGFGLTGLGEVFNLVGPITISSVLVH